GHLRHHRRYPQSGPGRAVTAGPPQQVGIGVLGYNGVARAHLLAVQRVATIFRPPAVHPLLIAVAGRSADRVEQAAQRYGAHAAYPDWQRLIDDRRRLGLIPARPHDGPAEGSPAAA